MTARSVSWTDPRKVAELLSRVSAERPEERRIAARPMGSILPAKPSGSAPRPSARTAQAPPPPPPAAPDPALEKPEARRPAKVPERLVHASENPSDRIDALIAWVLDNYPCSGAFLADDNGLTLAAHGITEAHVSIVGPLLSSLVGIRSVPGIDATAGALWLGAQMMSWVEVRIERGGFCLGAVGDEALSPAALDQLKAALAETLKVM